MTGHVRPASGSSLSPTVKAQSYCTTAKANYAAPYYYYIMHASGTRSIVLNYKTVAHLPCKQKSPPVILECRPLAPQLANSTYPP